MHTFTELAAYDRGSCDCDCSLRKKDPNHASDKVYRIKTPAMYYGLEQRQFPRKHCGLEGLHLQDVREDIREVPLAVATLCKEDLKRVHLLVIFDGGDEFRFQDQQEDRWDFLLPKDPPNKKRISSSS